MACRLAEKGAKVLVLERGRRWDPKDYPRKPGDAWFFDHEKPHKKNGWIDFRIYPDMAIIQGSAVGGGTHLRALDKATGEERCKFELPDQPTGVPMTYEEGGKQYVVLAVGSTPAQLIAFALK